VALSPAAAQEGYQGRLRGAVVYADRDSGRIFVQGARDGVFVDAATGQPAPEPGRQVEVEGTTAREEFYNVVTASRIQTLGPARVLDPVRVPATALAAGAHRYEWIEVAAVVRGITIENDEKPSLAVVAEGKAFTARLAAHTGFDYGSLVDARVRLRGIAHPIFNARGEVARLKVLVASLTDVSVDERASDPFAAEPRPIASLQRLGPEETSGHRVRVRGEVVAEQHDGVLRVRDATGELQVRGDDMPRLRGGDRIDVAGFASLDSAAPGLDHAVVRPVAAVAQASAGRPLRVLRSVREVHHLPAEEAKRGYPVRLRGVVTYFDPTVPFLFLQDATGGTYINCEGDAGLRLEAGQLVEVDGESDPGYFAPSVYRARVHVRGTAPLPPVPPLPLEDLLSGQQDSNWVEARGVVESVDRDVRGRVLLVLAAGAQRFYATVQGFAEKEELPTYLIDAKVAVRGACGAVFNEKRQLLGLDVYVPGPSYVILEEQSPPNPFALPSRPMRSRMSFHPGDSPGHRVRVRGVVTLHQAGESMFVKDETSGLHVAMREGPAVAPGDEVDVVGFASLGEYTPSLREAVFRKVASGPQPKAIPVTAEEAMSGNYHAQLVRIEAVLLDRVADSRQQVLTLQSGRYTFNAFLDRDAGIGDVELRGGALVQLTGVCLVEASQSQLAKAMRPRIESFRILLRAPGDVVVLRNAPWWTVGRALGLLGAVAVIAAVASGWVLLLRRKVNEAVSQLKVLRGLLPICASCKKIRDDVGSWKQMESYIREHSEAQFSHGVCPDCLVRLYPEFAGLASKVDA
jgi:hypothetical protein